VTSPTEPIAAAWNGDDQAAGVVVGERPPQAGHLNRQVVLGHDLAVPHMVYDFVAADHPVTRRYEKFQYVEWTRLQIDRVAVGQQQAPFGIEQKRPNTIVCTVRP